MGKNLVVIGMHMALGANHLDTEGGCIDVWNNVDFKNTSEAKHKLGFDEFYIELARHADTVEAEYDKLVAEAGDRHIEDVFGGLFELDISQALGEWFGAYVSENREPPSDDEFKDMLLELIEKFKEEEPETIVLNPALMTQ